MDHPTHGRCDDLVARPPPISDPPLGDPHTNRRSVPVVGHIIAPFTHSEQRLHRCRIGPSNTGERIRHNVTLHRALKADLGVSVVAPTTPSGVRFTRWFDATGSSVEDLDHASSGKPLFGRVNGNTDDLAGKSSLAEHRPTAVITSDTASIVGRIVEPKFDCFFGWFPP